MIYHSGSYDLDGLEDEVYHCTMVLSGLSFDGIVARGVSGTVLGVPVSMALRKPLVIVRKPQERCHSFEGLVNGKYITEGSTWIFVDDFVGGGNTMRACVEAVETKRGRVIGRYGSRERSYRERKGDNQGYYDVPRLKPPTLPPFTDEYAERAMLRSGFPLDAEKVNW